MPWYPTTVATGIREIAASAPDYQCEHFDRAISAAYEIVGLTKGSPEAEAIDAQSDIIENSVNTARDGIVALREKFVDLMHYADKEEDRANDNENARNDWITTAEALEEENNELKAQIEKLQAQLAEYENKVEAPKVVYGGEYYPPEYDPSLDPEA